MRQNSFWRVPLLLFAVGLVAGPGLLFAGGWEAVGPPLLFAGKCAAGIPPLLFASEKLSPPAGRRGMGQWFQPTAQTLITLYALLKSKKDKQMEYHYTKLQNSNAEIKFRPKVSVLCTLYSHLKRHSLEAIQVIFRVTRQVNTKLNQKLPPMQHV